MIVLSPTCEAATDVARQARAPAPLGSRREVSRERPTVLKQDATVVISLVYGVWNFYNYMYM